jgi:hypothetical protein
MGSHPIRVPHRAGQIADREPLIANDLRRNFPLTASVG